MDGLTIHISWEYFLGIMSALILVAWYANGRFTALETSMKWMKETINELKISSDNQNNKAFAVNSPVNLTGVGEKWLEESGLKEHIDNNKQKYIDSCEEKKNTNPYEVQQHIFRLFDELSFETAFEDKLKAFAFEQGTTMAIIRRIGGIYLRNLCLENFGMNRDDIDNHTPVAG